MDLSKKKKVEEQEVEVLMDNKEIEETKKNEDPETELEVRRPYIWANTVDDGDDELSTLSGDLSDMSIFAAGERLLKSHIFSAFRVRIHYSVDRLAFNLDQEMGRKAKNKSCLLGKHHQG